MVFWISQRKQILKDRTSFIWPHAFTKASSNDQLKAINSDLWNSTWLKARWSRGINKWFIWNKIHTTNNKNSNLLVSSNSILLFHMTVAEKQIPSCCSGITCQNATKSYVKACCFPAERHGGILRPQFRDLLSWDKNHLCCTWSLCSNWYANSWTSTKEHICNCW